MKIYVGNLPKTTNEEEIRKIFEEHGEVTEVKLITDRYTGGLRGFGFIEMPAKADEEKAIKEVNGHELGEQTLIVNEARAREDRSGGRGSGRRGGGGGGYGGSRTRSW